MADVERERVTALWREAAAALEGDAPLPLEPQWGQPYTDALQAECGRLREQLDAAREALEKIAVLRGWAAFDHAPGIARAALGVKGEQESVREKPAGWPEKCRSCGASWEHIGFDHADGFNCRACGRCDSDE